MLRDVARVLLRKYPKQNDGSFLGTKHWETKIQSQNKKILVPQDNKTKKRFKEKKRALMLQHAYQYDKWQSNPVGTSATALIKEFKKQDKKEEKEEEEKGDRRVEDEEE